MGYYLAASPSPTVSSRGAFWPPHCSPASSASYPEGQKKTYSSPHINIDGTTLNAVERFTYLSNVISKDATISKDLDSRLSKTNSSIGRLSKRVWQSFSLCLSTKIKVDRAVVIHTLLCGAETWAIKRSRSGYLSSFIVAACSPSLASNGKTTCQTKKSSRKPACPA